MRLTQLAVTAYLGRGTQWLVNMNNPSGYPWPNWTPKQITITWYDIENARKIQRRTARLTLCIHWSGKSLRHSSEGSTVLVHARQWGCQRSISDWWRTCTINAKLSWGVLQEQANPLQWKLDSTKDPLSALSRLPLWWIHWRTTSEKSTLVDDVRWWRGAVRKGERRAGMGTGAVEGSL